MGRIFISYRRDDTSGWVQHLATDLQARFGRDAVFVDIDKIRPGTDFAVAIEKTLIDTSVFLAVIGPHWLARLNDSNDFVRLEINRALQRNIFIIPVLVGNASMPDAEALPEELRPLAHRQALEFSDKRRAYDLEQLCRAIEEYLPGSRVRHHARIFGRRAAVPAGIALVFAALAMLYWRPAPVPERTGNSGAASKTAIKMLPADITTAPPYYEGKFAYRYVADGVTLTEPDTFQAPQRSRLLLLENGEALGPAHTVRQEVYRVGEGRYSHFTDGKDTDLIFSSSDNTDPRENKREYVVALTVNIPRRAIIKHSGFLYQYFGRAVRITRADSLNEQSHVSKLRLLEDGKELGPAHWGHEEIAKIGRGRYSHWDDGAGNVYLNFSTRDNSDPRTNGRTYALTIAE
jgi:hypothetical protein